MRYKITIEYDGTDFCGWQKQDNAPSVQQSIEEAIFKFSSEKVDVVGSGRTDTGVHALAQVAHFDLTKEYPAEEVLGAINFHARPNKLCILECQKVSDDFHARFSAKERSYIYKIEERKVPLILNENRVWRVPEKLDIVQIQQAADILIGTHDFSSFRASHCQSNTPIKTINNIKIIRLESQVHIIISAVSFLYHMVRNITGALYYVGCGKISVMEFEKIFQGKDRTRAPLTAPAEGLYFKEVKY